MNTEGSLAEKETETVLRSAAADKPEQLDGGTPAGGDAVFRRGACLGRYVVLHALGSGGMGHVFAAYDPELDRKVAVKVLRSEYLVSEAREEAQTRLLREAQAIAKLAHPNVVSVFDVGTVGERLFVAMELIEGEVLDQWLTREARSWREILRVFLAAGGGLAAAHEVGLVHRDFKPGNVMVGDDGRARVLDFGLARTMEPPEGERQRAAEASPDQLLATPLTQTGQPMGTPAYMAPEQHRGLAADARSDQFSFCLTLWEALYGELPFAGEKLGELRRSVLEGRIREAPPDAGIPGWVRRVLDRGLAVDPAARFDSMAEFLAALAKDPAARRRRRLQAVAWVVAPLAALAGLLIFRTGEASLCTGAQRQLAGIWDADRRAAIRETFLASDQPFAEKVWHGVRAALDAYTAEWTALRTEACEATHLRGEQSEEMLDRQMACLDARLYEIRAATGLLAQADEQVLTNALAVANGLTSLSGCADRRALMALVPPPQDEAARRRVKAIREQLAENRALEEAGKYPEALELAATAFAAAEELAYRPLVGEAHFRLARSHGRLGRTAELRDHLLEAAYLAHVTHHEELAAEAFVSLIVAAYLRGEPEEARMWGRLAEGVIEGLGGRDELETLRQEYLGMVAHSVRDYERARQHFEKALDLKPRPTPTWLGMTWNRIGATFFKQDRLDEAHHAFQKAVDTLESGYGEGHFTMAAPHLNLGRLHEARGDLDASLTCYEKGLQITRRHLGPQHPNQVFLLISMGSVLIAANRSAAAVERLEQAIRVGEAHPEYHPEYLAIARFRLAEALWQSGGDRRRAQRLALRARDGFREFSRSTPELDPREIEDWLRERFGDS
ncbi:MAG: serine/threonine protein kinase [bacterium]|nr:serine/threonine protein kinase [bacterium]